MPNVRFTYLYRDAGNYKQWADVVFSNPDRLSVTDIDSFLRRAFLQDGLFIARQIRLPDIFPFAFGDATSDDHCFHEFSGVEFTDAAPNNKHFRSIPALIAETDQASRHGWVAFDPHDGPTRSSFLDL